MQNNRECPICGSHAFVQSNADPFGYFITCPVCGRYSLVGSTWMELVKDPHLASYLFHNSFSESDCKYRYNTTLSKEKCDEYNKEFIEGDNTHGRPVHFDKAVVDHWYPKSFSERVDYIMLCLSALIKHIGQSVNLNLKQLCGLLFVDQKEEQPLSRNSKWRNVIDCYKEVNFMLNYLVSSSLIACFPAPNMNPESYELTITANGFMRIDSLQKNTAKGKMAFVAMQFGDCTVRLREAIRKGIEEAGYIAVFIDEVPHNEFITPEIMKYIRDSRFVVVDLTHQNNGAYFEEGYAMGYGKPVIQLCQKDTKLHFDIAQKNTIMWVAEDDIPLRLANRIKATIE